MLAGPPCKLPLPPRAPRFPGALGRLASFLPYDPWSPAAKTGHPGCQGGIGRFAWHFARKQVCSPNRSLNGPGPALASRFLAY